MVAVVVWIFFQITVKDPLARPQLLDQAVMLVLGSWVTYRGLKRNGNGNGDGQSSGGGTHRARD